MHIFKIAAPFYKYVNFANVTGGHHEIENTAHNKIFLICKSTCIFKILYHYLQ